MEAPVEPGNAIDSRPIVDPTKKVEGFILPRKDWVTWNRFRTDVEKCRSDLERWEIINYARCDYEVPIQTMQHIFNECSLTKGTGRPPSDNICKILDS